MSDMIADRTSFLSELKRSLATQARGIVDLQALLERLLENLEAAVGTIHGLEPGGIWCCWRRTGLDPELTGKVQRIPPGKGLAGLAAKKRAPVEVCNLQTDTSGQAKPAAGQTGAGGARSPFRCSSMASYGACLASL